MIICAYKQHNYHFLDLVRHEPDRNLPDEPRSLRLRQGHQDLPLQGHPEAVMIMIKVPYFGMNNKPIRSIAARFEGIFYSNCIPILGLPCCIP